MVFPLSRYLFFDTDINSVSSFKYLGVMLSSTFTWSDHIEYISCKVNKNLGLLRRIKYYLPYDARLLFYNSLVLPIFDLSGPRACLKYLKAA